MIETTNTLPSRVIVIPRPLEDFFYERLARHYAQDEGVRVVIDRRMSERRDLDREHDHRVRIERRTGQRRRVSSIWKLSDMPNALPQRS